MKVMTTKESKQEALEEIHRRIEKTGLINTEKSYLMLAQNDDELDIVDEWNIETVSGSSITLYNDNFVEIYSDGFADPSDDKNFKKRALEFIKNELKLYSGESEVDNLYYELSEEQYVIPTDSLLKLENNNGSLYQYVKNLINSEKEFEEIVKELDKE